MADSKQSPQGSARRSGTADSGDPTSQPGQNPDSIFGATVPDGTGAPGSSPTSGADDAINQPGEYPSHNPFGGADYPQGTGAPGSAGRSAGEGSTATSARVSDIGAEIYGTTAADHALESDDTPRGDGQYPPTRTPTPMRIPKSTGAGTGTVRGAGHPNSGA